MKKLLLLACVIGFVAELRAQLTVAVSQPKVSSQKAIVALNLKNSFGQKVDSARAVVFLLDEQGKMVAQGTRWVIGGTKDKSGLDPNQEITFNFVVQADKPFLTTNLTTKVSFSQLILEGGKQADIAKDVIVTPAATK